jgi:glucose 1-dehydrogenase
VRDLGATLHTDLADIGTLKPDIVMECTGAAPVVREVLGRTGASGIVCLLSVTAPKSVQLDIGTLNRTMVLENDTVFGSVNANRDHYEMAVKELARADKAWLAKLITRRVPLTRWFEALESRPDDIKVVLDFTL